LTRRKKPFVISNARDQKNSLKKKAASKQKDHPGERAKN